MERKAFDNMSLAQIDARATSEPEPTPGSTGELDRPWSQLGDEMREAGAATVGDLPTSRGDVFFDSTKAADTDPVPQAGGAADSG